jgi:basic amino acid/polyamine antiporter, APA family
MVESVNNTPQFHRRLNLFDSTMIVMGSMIGSGIYIVSADMARILGSPGLLIIAWLLTGAMTVLAALAYGELAGMFPHAGGQYVFLREAYNPLVGFLYGWTLFLVIQTGTIAAVGVAFAKFTGVLIPWFSVDNVLIDFGLFKFNTTQLLGIISIIFLTLINLRGIVIGKHVQNFFTVTKSLVLAAFIILGLFFLSNSNSLNINISNFWGKDADSFSAIGQLSGFAIIAGLGMAMVGSLFSADAWNNITFTAAEVINPRKTIPLSLFFGTASVILIYILCNLVYLNILPFWGTQNGADVIERGIQYAAQDRVGTAAMEEMIGTGGAALMAIFIMFSTFGCNNGLILAGARVYYAMADDKLFFKSAQKLNKRSVPAAALLIQCVWACLLCLTGSYSDLLDYVVFAVLVFYVLTILGIFILRWKKPDMERPYKAFGYPVLPSLYIISALVIMVILLIYKPQYTWPGLIIVLIGIPVYFVWKWKKK